MKTENPSRMAFVFLQHEATLNQVLSVTQETESQLRETFVPDQVNIFVVERGTWSGVVTKDPVFTQSAVDFDFNISAQEARNEEIRKYGIKEAHSVQVWDDHIRGIVYRGGNTEHLHKISQLKAVDQLNQEGYNIGLLYEDGIKVTDRIQDFLLGSLKVNLLTFRRLENEVKDLVDLRDKKLLNQINKVAENYGESVNFFIPRGRVHGGMIELLPQPLKEKITFAISTVPTKTDGLWEMNNLERIMRSDREPTEEEWLRAYNQYMQLPKK